MIEWMKKWFGQRATTAPQGDGNNAQVERDRADKSELERRLHDAQMRLKILEWQADVARGKMTSDK